MGFSYSLHLVLPQKIKFSIISTGIPVRQKFVKHVFLYVFSSYEKIDKTSIIWFDFKFAIGESPNLFSKSFLASPAKHTGCFLISYFLVAAYKDASNITYRHACC